MNMESNNNSCTNTHYHNDEDALATQTYNYSTFISVEASSATHISKICVGGQEESEREKKLQRGRGGREGE